jgi:hypothetical protein
MALIATCVTVGCSTIETGPTQAGELGNGRFRYVCAGTTDPYCDDGYEASSFPPTLAVGSRFSLRYELEESGESAVVEPASRVALSKEGSVFTLHQRGYVAVLAQTAFGDVVDILHLNANDVAVFEVFADSPAPLAEIELAVGERLDLRVDPKDDLGTLVAGSLAYAWSTPALDTVVRIASATDSDTVTVQGLATGYSMLTLTAGDSTVSLPVAVGEGGTATSTAGDTDSTGAASTGDASTSDASTGDASTGDTGDSSTGDASTGDTSTGTTEGN